MPTDRPQGIASWDQHQTSWEPDRKLSCTMLVWFLSFPDHAATLPYGLISVVFGLSPPLLG
jgi:hypothetical protein